MLKIIAWMKFKSHQVNSDGDLFMILKTERLILRTWKTEDVALMAEISSDPLVMEHFPYTQDLAATQKSLDHINQHHEKFDIVYMQLK